MYVLGGNKRMPRRLKKRFEKHYQFRQQQLKKHCSRLPELNQPLQMKYLSQGAGFPYFQNSYCRFFPTASQMYDEMISHIKTAESFIFLEYFIISDGFLWGEIMKILQKKASMGVDVRVIYDDFGTITQLPLNYPKRLAELGIKAVEFNRCTTALSTVVNYRTHRKICVIDGETAFCGGANIADDYINRLPMTFYWKDTGVMLRGECTCSVTMMFLSLWEFCNGEETADICRFLTQ